MILWWLFAILGLLDWANCQEPRIDFSTFIHQVDSELDIISAGLAVQQWKTATNKQPEQIDDSLSQFSHVWLGHTCRNISRWVLSDTWEERVFASICRGPFYEGLLGDAKLHFQRQLTNIYQSSQVCLPNGCLKIEPDLANMMKTTRNPDLLKFIWRGWRNVVSSQAHVPFFALIPILNVGASINGYDNIEHVWKMQSEVIDVEDMMEQLLSELAPLHRLLHAYVRYKLKRYYGLHELGDSDTIPAHLLGNMWAQDWNGIFDIVHGKKSSLNLTGELVNAGYSVEKMISFAESLYVSIGLKPMPPSFRENSVFNNTEGLCHGTAFNMFRKNDYRMVMCASVTEDDYNTIIHEMGHIQYYMAYQNQRPVFRNAHPALHEAIGDTMVLVANSLANYKRMGLDIEKSPDLEMQILLKRALAVIPQLPFAYVMDKWRYTIFRIDFDTRNSNQYWWQLHGEQMGVRPPVIRTDLDLDAAAKYHIIENIPYSKYFFSNILQFQFFEAMCKNSKYYNPSKPLHQCDIVGSRKAGRAMRKMMMRGNSIHFGSAVYMMTNSSISMRPLLEYFKPLEDWLIKEIDNKNISVGWRREKYKPMEDMLLRRFD